MIASGEKEATPSQAAVLSEAWALEADDAAKGLETDPLRGLSQDQVRQRQRRYGYNALKSAKRRPAWSILIDQFKNLIIALLAAAAFLSLFFGQSTEAVAIGAALLLNAAIGFFTEYNATRSMESLHKMAKTNARVRRGGRLTEIPASELVPGDLVELEAGDVVPADMRLMEANRLEADESALTGESLPVVKHREPVALESPMAERGSMLFKGTALASGSALGLVTSTGMATQLGRVSQLTEQAEPMESSPLQQRLSRLGRRLVWATLAVALAVGLIGWAAGRPWLLIVETAVALAVAAIPEGLPMVATIALARGMWRMARHKAVIKHLAAVETLGSTTIICTDKTGTLTANKMELARLALPGEGEPRLIETPEEGLEPGEDDFLRSALETGVLCVNAGLNSEGETLGDPLEGALLRAGRAAGIERDSLLSRLPEEREDAFDTRKKMMATFHVEGQGYRVAVKGAPEAVLAACTHEARKGGDTALGEDARRRWLRTNREMAAQGLRVIALAQRNAENIDEEPYSDLIMLGLAGFWDPPRQSAVEAVEACQRAGIRVVMVTGDQPATAAYIGSEIGLVSESEDAVVTGRDLAPFESMDEAGRRRLRQASIFARVTPEQKLDLIALHQDAGNVVAMTGDGVNDAPALKKADIGVAMGKRGTQVAREAADMVLSDDSLGSIVVAVQEGRAIFANIRRFILYLLSGNMAEIMTVGAAILLGWPLPLLPLQILYLNMIGDVFPALALGVGKGGPQYLQQAPRKLRESVLASQHWWALTGWGALIALVVLIIFGASLNTMNLSKEQAVTISFLTLSFARLWHVFNMRRPSESPLLNEVTLNPFVWGAIVLCAALLIVAEFVEPLRTILSMAILPAEGWWLIAIGSIASLLTGQIVLQIIGYRQKTAAKE